MPSQAWPNFCGQAYRDRSLNADAETCVNLYLATSLSGKNPKKQMLLGTPGLVDFKHVVNVLNPGRGIFAFSGLSPLGAERCFTVFQDSVQEINANGDRTTYGTLIDDGKPVSMASNGFAGKQVLIVGGGQVKVLDCVTNTLSGPIAGSWVNAPIMCTFQDEFFHLLESNSPRIWYSNPEDGLIWPGLQFYERSVTSDNAVAMTAAGGRIWIFGTETSEAFYNSGNATTPFVPIQGSLFEIGIESPFGWALQGDTIAWIGRSARGGQRMYQLKGYGGVPISTPAIEYALNTYADLTQTEALAYEQEGHSFIAWTIPGVATWVIDMSEPGQPWHQRGTWNSDLGAWQPWRARGHAYAFGQNLVGDWFTNKIGRLDLSVYDEYSTPLVAERAAPYLSDDNQWIFLDQIELGCESGVGNDAVPDPMVELALSKDSGHTFGQAQLASLGKLGEFTARPRWFLLGRARPDRLVLRIRISDAVKRALGPGLWLTLQHGTGQR